MTEAVGLPAMIGLTLISGPVGAGIQVGQLLNGQGFSKWEHAFTMLPGNLILEAEPGGAVIRPFHYGNQDVYWCTGIYRRLLGSRPDGETGNQLGEAVMAVAEQKRGTGYSFLDYDALFALRLHIPDFRVWPNRPGPDGTKARDDKRLLTLREFVADSGHEICSQDADDVQLRLGNHVFTDNRLPQDVTPASLWIRDLELAGA